MSETTKYDYRKWKKDPERRVVGKIGRCNVTVLLGDMTDFKTNAPSSPADGDAPRSVDAYVVPELGDGGGGGGMRATLKAAGCEPGLIEYDSYPENPFYGQAILTSSGGGKTPFLLHAVCKREHDRSFEYGVVKRALYEALIWAGETKEINRIAVPAMGTGGAMTDRQSAIAMMSAVKEYSKTNDTRPLDIYFVLYGDRAAHAEFERTLTFGSYHGAKDAEDGQKEPSPALAELKKDLASGHYPMKFFQAVTERRAERDAGNDNSAER